MKNFKLSLILDRILLIVVLFAILFVWLRFFIDNIYIVLLLCSTIVLAVYILVSFLVQKNNQRQAISKAQKSLIEQYATHLMFMQPQKTLQFFYELLSKKNNAIIKKDYIIIDKTVFFSFMHHQKLTLDDLAHAFSLAQQLDAVKLIMCTQNVPTDISTLCKNIQNMNIILLDKSAVYFGLLKPYEMYPPKTIEISHKKMTFKNIFEHSFQRAKFKQYMLSGFLILFCSLFMRYNIYYVLMSTLLFGLSAACLFKRPQKFTHQIF